MTQSAGGRRISIRLVRGNAEAIAEMLLGEAPRTCEMFWSALPLHATVCHGRRSGAEIYFLIPPAGESPGRENATIFPVPGDVTFAWFPPGYREMPRHVTVDTTAGLYDVMIFYGRDSQPVSPEGPTPVNVFATIVEGLEEFARACEDVWLHGCDEIIVDRVP